MLIDDTLMTRKIFSTTKRKTKPLYRTSNTPYIPVIAHAPIESVTLDVNFDFALAKFLPRGRDICGATEAWMLGLSGDYRPLDISAKDIEQAIRKELSPFVVDNGVFVRLNGMHLKVFAQIKVAYSETLTLKKIHEDIERFVVSALNNLFKKLSTKKPTAKRTLKEKLQNWAESNIPFTHFNGRVFSATGPDVNIFEVKLKTSPTESINILRCIYLRYGTIFVRRNTSWPAGTEKLKRQILEALPTDRRYEEMIIE